MIRNHYGGLFITVDGPNGAGKTSLVQGLKDTLRERGFNAQSTKSPTDTLLGLFTREASETLYGTALMCLIAADRYQDLEKEIIPRLSSGQIVIADRYVLSSLILQRMDGVSEDFILRVHDTALLPDIQIAVTASECVIAERLSKREHLHRIEQGNRASEELRLTSSGVAIMRKLGVATLCVDNSADIDCAMLEITQKIMEALDQNVR